MLSAQEQLDILMRGVIEVVPEAELLKKLENSVAKKQPLRIKLGVDPTAPDVHLGHTVVMRKLAQFQKLGHQVILIVGDYTATVGDPSGRSSARPRLTHAEVLENAKTYQEQFFKVVNREQTEIVYNGDWFKTMTFDQITQLMGQITVAQMLEREDFQNRYRQGNPISLHEFLYPLMQGYDSLKINSDVELGGTDQKFNVLRGRDIQINEGQEPQIGLFMPILLGTDGKIKMSKSVGNYIGINEAPDVMFHKIYNIPDEIMEDWFILLTDLPNSEIDKIIGDVKSGVLSPSDAKNRLALDVVSQYYDIEKAQAAAQREKAVHTGQALPSDALYLEIDPGEYQVADFLVNIGAFKSKGEARRMVQNGGVRLNDEKIADPVGSLDVKAQCNWVVRVGKRRCFVVNTKD